jgi:prophage DNA circulation protein
MTRHFLFAGVDDNLILSPVVTSRQVGECTMTLEEMAKKIESILEMQAQFEANVGKLAANLARSETNTDNLRVSVADLAGVVKDLVKISDDRFSRFDEQMKDLATTQKVTGERLNALINVMEKHFTGPDHAARP